MMQPVIHLIKTISYNLTLQAESPISLNMRQIGLFVALYDYNPQTMSPNAENCEEELGFTEGQLIKVMHYSTLHDFRLEIFNLVIT